MRQTYSCSKCDIVFKHELFLNVHLNSHTESEKPLDCAPKEKIPTGIVLKIEKSPTKITKVFACAKCDKTFQNSSILKRHEMIHTDQKTIACIKYEDAFFDTD